MDFDIISDKKIDYKTYGKIQVESYWNMEKKERHRYIYENGISFSEWAKDLGISRQTVSKNFKYFVKCGLIKRIKDRSGKICYLIPNGFNFYLKIEEKLLRIMSRSLSSNAIKVYLVYRSFNDHYGKPCTLSKKDVLERIGLNTKSNNNEDILTDINKTLETLGLIEITKIIVNDENGKVKKNLSIKTLPYKDLKLVR